MKTQFVLSCVEAEELCNTLRALAVDRTAIAACLNDKEDRDSMLMWSSTLMGMVDALEAGNAIEIEG